MSGHDGQPDLTWLERMERRLQALGDAEAISNLKSHYTTLCDDNYDADGIAALFTEDATGESRESGSIRGPGSDPEVFPGRGGDLLSIGAVTLDRADELVARICEADRRRGAYRGAEVIARYGRADDHSGTGWWTGKRCEQRQNRSRQFGVTQRSVQNRTAG